MVVLIIKLTKYCLVLAQGNIGMSLLASDYQERRRLQAFTFALISEISLIDCIANNVACRHYTNRLCSTSSWFCCLVRGTIQQS